MINIVKLVTLYKKGYSLRDIARRFDVSHEWVRQLIKTKVKMRPKWNKEECKLKPYKNKIVGMVKQGISATEIAQKMGVCRMTVVRALLKWNLPIIRKKSWRRFDEKKIVELYKKGTKILDICRRLKIKSWNTVFNYLRRLGVKLRKEYKIRRRK